MKVKCSIVREIEIEIDDKYKKYDSADLDVIAKTDDEEWQEWRNDLDKELAKYGSNFENLFCVESVETGNTMFEI